MSSIYNYMKEKGKLEERVQRKETFKERVSYWNPETLIICQIIFPSIKFPLLCWEIGTKSHYPNLN